MQRFHADIFLSTLNTLADVEFMVRADASAVMGNKNTVAYITSRIQTLTNQIRQMGLFVSARKADDILSNLRSEYINYEAAGGLLIKQSEELRERLAHELEGRVIYYFPSGTRHLEESAPEFGITVAASFPSASYDIAEAGKCLALGRTTACVFHLMRVMEIGMHRLADTLGVELNPRWGWSKILEVVEGPINALPETSGAERTRKKELQQARGHLHAVRLGWRNDTMHPKETYTAEEAERLLKHVETFMRHLADHLESP